MVDEASSSARLLVADDHDVIRMAMRTMLREEPDLNVVGEAKDGREAVDPCCSLRPDLVLMDVSMPGMDGIEATREIKDRYPGTVVLMITAFEDLDYLLEAVRAGAAGYVLKHSGREELLGAMRGELRGEASLDRELAMLLLQRVADETGGQRTRPGYGSNGRCPEGRLPGSLTTRELDVLALLAAGKTNRQIAGDLHLSLSTVKGHLERIHLQARRLRPHAGGRQGRRARPAARERGGVGPP